MLSASSASRPLMNCRMVLLRKIKGLCVLTKAKRYKTQCSASRNNVTRTADRKAFIQNVESLAFEDGRDDVPELRRGERVAFQVRGEPAAPVDHGRVQRVDQRALVLPEFDAEGAGDL